MAEKEKKEQETWILGEVATQTEQVIVHTKTKETLTIHTALVKILNNQEKLMKLLD